ncbi:MAG: glycosyltransferase family 2 protein [Candidatus Omnitrophica bacterium]|nr:glycosyltransferase family 2 protein [Candidatus Omnitrophota bacterium]
MNEDLGILIPAYNEEKTIGGIVKKLKETFSMVVVVDDGSTDKTSSLAGENGAIVLKHVKRSGKGRALQTGFSFLTGKNVKAILTMDADDQHKVSDIKNFLSAYKRRPDVDIWIGKRKIKKSLMPFIRRLTNISMSLLISLLSLQYIPDTQSGFRLIKSCILKNQKFRSSYFEMESELLIKSSLKGAGIGSVLIETVYEKQRSKINPIKDTIRFFKMLFFVIFDLWKKT